MNKPWEKFVVFCDISGDVGLAIYQKSGFPRKEVTWNEAVELKFDLSNKFPEGKFYIASLDIFTPEVY